VEDRINGSWCHLIHANRSKIMINQGAFRRG
jgi:hypothetical protein